MSLTNGCSNMFMRCCSLCGRECEVLSYIHVASFNKNCLVKLVKLLLGVLNSVTAESRDFFFFNCIHEDILDLFVEEDLK